MEEPHPKSSIGHQKRQSKYQTSQKQVYPITSGGLKEKLLIPISETNMGADMRAKKMTPQQ